MGHYDNSNMGKNQEMARRSRVGLSACEKREREQLYRRHFRSKTHTVRMRANLYLTKRIP